MIDETDMWTLLLAAAFIAFVIWDSKRLSSTTTVKSAPKRPNKLSEQSKLSSNTDSKDTSIALRCGLCGTTGKGRESMIGREVRCKHCYRTGIVTQFGADQYILAAPAALHEIEVISEELNSSHKARPSTNRTATNRARAPLTSKKESKPKQNKACQTKSNRRKTAPRLRRAQPKPRNSALEQKRLAIRKFVKDREISAVYHFTCESNIPSIIKSGLLPRNELLRRKLHFTFNDNLRLDNAEGSISVSISFPNYRMFYRLRKDDPETRWVVLSLSPEVLWSLPCAYCSTNAASNQVRHKPIQDRISFEALQQMYSDDTIRLKTRIPSSYPTCPQAEVLVLEPIPPSMIHAVCVESKQDQKRVSPLTQSLPCIVKPDIFDRRCDWRHWSPYLSL